MEGTEDYDNDEGSEDSEVECPIRDQEFPGDVLGYGTTSLPYTTGTGSEGSEIECLPFDQEFPGADPCRGTFTLQFSRPGIEMDKQSLSINVHLPRMEMELSCSMIAQLLCMEWMEHPPLLFTARERIYRHLKAMEGIDDLDIDEANMKIQKWVYQSLKDTHLLRMPYNQMYSISNQLNYTDVLSQGLLDDYFRFVAESEIENQSKDDQNNITWKEQFEVLLELVIFYLSLLLKTSTSKQTRKSKEDTLIVQLLLIRSGVEVNPGPRTWIDDIPERQMPTYNELCLLSRCIGNGWRHLGTKLYLSQPQMDHIEHDNNGMQSQIYHMLLKGTSPPLEASLRDTLMALDVASTECTMTVEWNEITFRFANIGHGQPPIQMNVPDTIVARLADVENKIATLQNKVTSLEAENKELKTKIASTEREAQKRNAEEGDPSTERGARQQCADEGHTSTIHGVQIRGAEGGDTSTELEERQRSIQNGKAFPGRGAQTRSTEKEEISTERGAQNTSTKERDISTECGAQQTSAEDGQALTERGEQTISTEDRQTSTERGAHTTSAEDGQAPNESRTQKRSAEERETSSEVKRVKHE